MNSIVPLFIDSEDVPGKRVMLKVNSGPGRMNINLIARLCQLGFYLYPGVPNTTAVSQEMDWICGPFKTQYQTNLAQMVDQRIVQGKSISLQPCLVAIPVFGGVDPVTNKKLEIVRSQTHSIKRHAYMHGKRLVLFMVIPALDHA